MSLKHLASAGLLAAAVFAVGCDKTEPAPATPATPASGATADKAMSAAADIKAKMAGEQNNVAAAAADMKTKAADAGNTMIAEATKLYEQASSAVSGGKFDDAQKYVDQLKTLKDKLPADWVAKIDALEKTLVDAKAKLGALPSMPSMPK